MNFIYSFNKVLGENNLNKKLEEEIKTKGIPGLIKYLEELY
jgi:hypothetical protein